jgi:3-deoxy-manno-octulosonate cytidylyltransferase (CMP-KDO synthetase)
MYFSRSVVPYLRGVEQNEWLEKHTFYKHLGVYAYRLDVLKQITSLTQTPLEKMESLEQLRWLENGYTIRVGVTDIETIGIDTPEDLEKAEAYLKDLKY